MSLGYVLDGRRSEKDLRHITGVDYWVDCQLGGRDIRFRWRTVVYPGDPSEEEVETFEVLNREGTLPMLDDVGEIFELNRMRDYESLDLFGTTTTSLEQAVRMSRLNSSTPLQHHSV